MIGMRPLRANGSDRGHRIAAKARRGIRIRRLDQVEQVVGDAGARRGIRLRRSDVHAAIDLRGIRADDFAAETLGERECDRGFARRGRAAHDGIRSPTDRRMIIAQINRKANRKTLTVRA